MNALMNYAAFASELEEFGKLVIDNAQDGSWTPEAAQQVDGMRHMLAMMIDYVNNKTDEETSWSVGEVEYVPAGKSLLYPE